MGVGGEDGAYAAAEGVHLEVECKWVVAGIVSVELCEQGEVSGYGRAGRRFEDAEELVFREFL